MGQRVFATADLHGHFDQWIRLYNKLQKEANFDPKKDILVVCGDSVDGGSQTKQLIEWFITMQKKYPNWVILLGNHEDLMLDALVYNGRVYGSFDLWYQQGGKQTVYSYFPDTFSPYEKAISQIKDYIPVEHLDWMRKLPIYWENDKYFFVHGGVLPDVSLESHKKQLEEGNEHLRQQMMWIRHEFIDSDYKWEKKIIFGHTTSSKPRIMDNKIGVDGMFHNQGNLWVVELPAEIIYEEKSRLEDTAIVV